MPTRRGVGLLVAAAGLYIQALLLGIRELHGLAAASLLFPLTAIAFVRWSRHKILCTRSTSPPRAFAGGTVRFSITARNLGRLPSPPLILEDQTAPGLGGDVRVVLPMMAPGTQTAAAVERRLSRRGRYTMGPLRARLVDPFGLAEARATVAGTSSIIVYPQIEQLHETGPPQTSGGVGKRAIQQLAAAGEEFYAIRDWEEGDDLRKIHWRSSARLGELMIRQDEVRPFPHATLLLDTRLGAHRSSARSSSLEWGISAAASVIWELARQGFALRLATPEGGPGGARWGREAADPLLTVLANAGDATPRHLQPVVRRLAGPGSGGALLAIMGPPEQAAMPKLVRLSRSYGWCGAVLIDTASFGQAGVRERASFDQRLADTERTLARADWRVSVAGSADRFKDVWQSLFSGTSRSSLASRPL